MFSTIPALFAGCKDQGELMVKWQDEDAEESLADALTEKFGDQEQFSP